jgi:hypothetical protein
MKPEQPMSNPNDHPIQSREALREVVGDSLPVVGLKILDRLDEFGRDFLARCPFLVLSTADAQGNVDSSPKGDAPGFVLIEDDETIVIPDRPGNKLAYGHENVLANPHVGLLCLIPGTSETLRINGRAELTADPELLERLAARGRPAVLATRVRIDQCFFHCGKAFIRSNLWKPEKWGERHRVSFGEMLGPKTGGGADAVKTIDGLIESDYRDNL